MGQQAAAGIGAVVGNGGLAGVPAAAPPSSAPPDVSVGMPCLNEAATLSRGLPGAQAAFRDLGLRGEVVVADNGSTDASAEIARSLGARVVVVAERGYGSALRGGIAAARADLIVMGDADDSYDFSRLEPFVTALRAGAGLVMGNRLTGGVEPRALAWKHPWVGNPRPSAPGGPFFPAPGGGFHF